MTVPVLPDNAPVTVCPGKNVLDILGVKYTKDDENNDDNDGNMVNSK